MQTLTFHDDTKERSSPVISNYQGVPRNNCKLNRIREAVKAWNRATPGAAQLHISQIVAKEWIARGGRGLLLAGSEHNTRQNFFRMINDPGPKNDKSLVQLIPVIIDVMALDNEEVARRFGLISGKTKAELIADAIKECAEAKRAVMLDAPRHQKLKEVSEGIVSMFRLEPDLAGPLMAMVTTMLGAI
ncbi:toxin YdaT family protein [Superficieibacter sp. 1612_C1]|uniref:toxin YdaT family protein n=1 Tax=Superficieibacter sp. 1612_C1 TaxID=2780382 RepID=UPI00159F9B32|nr:toxin YdaT family protein [Superficieibacter sp. 1612_C1]